MLKLQLIGNLGQDATVNNVNGKNVINFSVGVTERWKDAQGNQKERTTWVNCSMWRDNTSVAAYLKKGTQVYVEGSAEAKTYTTKQGEAIATLNVRVSEMKLLGSKQATTTQPQEAADITEPIDDLPF